MDFLPDPLWLLTSLPISGVGFVAFVYGKRQGRLPQLLYGITLFVFPYFVSNILVMLSIAAALSIALWIALRMGL